MAKRNTLIISVVVVIVIVILIAVSVWFFMRRRKKEEEDGQNGEILENGMKIRLKSGSSYLGACGSASSGNGASSTGASGGSNIGFNNKISGPNTIWTLHKRGGSGRTITYGSSVSLSISPGDNPGVTYLTFGKGTYSGGKCDGSDQINTTTSDISTVTIAGDTPGKTGSVVVGDSVKLQTSKGKFVALCSDKMKDSICSQAGWIEAVENDNGTTLIVSVIK